MAASRRSPNYLKASRGAAIMFKHRNIHRTSCVATIKPPVFFYGHFVATSSTETRCMLAFDLCSLGACIMAIDADSLGAGGAAFTLSHGGVNLYVMALALLCAPRHPGDKTYDDEDDDIARAARTVNPIAHHRTVEVVEGRGPSYTESSGKWWQGKQRPKIRDSSVWEDEVAVEL